jgi:hypothetical protein
VSEITEALNLAATTANVVGDVWRERLAAMTAERDELKEYIKTWRMTYTDMTTTAARCAEIAENLDVDPVGMDSNDGITNAQNTWGKGSMDTGDAIAYAIRKEFNL